MTKIVLILSIFFCGAVTFTQGQNALQKNTCGDAAVGTAVERKLDLKQVDLGILTACVPKVLEAQERKCIDGQCWTFSGGELLLTIDHSPYAGRPTFERDYPTYEEEHLIVDGVRTHLWSFVQGPPHRFVSGATYATEKGGKIGVGIYLSSKSVDSREIAKRVFVSIRFKKTDR